MKKTRSLLAALVAATLMLGACSGGGSTATADPVLDRVSPATAQEIIAGEAGDADFVLLDVRTPEEFAEVHLDGAVNLDFYAADFADSLASLDRDATYVIYCRTGNRSGTTLEMMRDLGFSTVHDVDGGIVAWYEDGLPLVTP